MTDLATRLKAATEGSRELDEDFALAMGIWRAWLSKHRYWNFEGPAARRFHWPQDGIPEYDSETGKKIELTDAPWHGWCWDAGLPEFTRSVDDGLALAGDDWAAILGEAFDQLCELDQALGGDFTLARLPLFICAALVRAKEQETASE